MAKKLSACGNGAQMLLDFGSEMCGKVAEKLFAHGILGRRYCEILAVRLRKGGGDALCSWKWGADIVGFRQ